MNKPLVSIITICLNSEKTISDTVKSVLGQDYPNIEYIIIDGISGDSTLEIIKAFHSDKIVLNSEKDHGLYDALNKGFEMSTGEIIGILHSDDFYAGNEVISSIVAEFEKDTDLDGISTSVHIFKPGNLNAVYRKYRATRFKSWQFNLGMQPPHPGFFIRRKGFEKVGYFNTSYKISGDFDWLFRAIRIYHLKVLYSRLVSVNMRDGGMSSSGIGSKRLMNRENLKILKSHGTYSNKLMIYSKYLLKVFQFV